MARRPTFGFTSTDRGWKVEIPSSFSASGKRERTYFRTRDAAKQFAAKLKEDVSAHGANAAVIGPALAHEALMVEKLLQAYGITLTEAARRVIKVENEKIASIDVATALSQFLLSKDGITVTAESAKTSRRRFIEMPPVLAAWLNAYPVADTVLPANWTRKEKAVRRLAGWSVWCNLVEPAEPPADLPDWPNNALRHTHASVMVALGKPLDSLTFEFGHAGGAAVLKAHYVGVMTKAEAIRIWSTGPNGTVIPLIEEVASPLGRQPKAPVKKTAAKRAPKSKAD